MSVTFHDGRAEGLSLRLPSWMHLGEYQEAALRTNRNNLTSAEGMMPALLGLGSEAGSILNVYKKRLRDHIDAGDAREQLAEELGDILWYLAVVAEGAGLNLEDIAKANIERSTDRYNASEDALNAPRHFDADFPAAERFPRQLTFEFTPVAGGEHPASITRLVNYQPRIEEPSVLQPGDQLGHKMDDNDPEYDGYRFHDVLHMGFLAVLGWSATLRKYLRRKRKSDPNVDRHQDGARALFKEEGLTAVLAELARSHLNFQSPLTVNGEVLRVVRAITRGLEVDAVTNHEWTLAISEGFTALNELKRHDGGLIHVDLDRRRLQFEPRDASK